MKNETIWYQDGMSFLLVHKESIGVCESLIARMRLKKLKHAKIVFESYFENCGFGIEREVSTKIVKEKP